MPFIVVANAPGCPSSKPYGVFTETAHGSGKSQGSPHGCFPSRAAATAQQKALYANVPDAKSEAPAPPNLRDAEPDSDERCGTCKMYDADAGACWGYGNAEVADDEVCDSYAPEPTDETKSSSGEVSMSITVPPGLTEHTAEWREQRAKALASAERRPSAWRRETTAPLELRDGTADSDVRVLRSYASLFNTPYTIRSSSHRFQEKVRPGAFKRSLNRGPDVVFRTDHHGPPLGRTTSNSLRLGEDERGLWYEVDLNLADPDVQALIPKIERGDYSESSFAFRCIDDIWTDDYTERELRECELDRGDVSVVTFGASRATGRHMLLRSEEALRQLQEIGFERVLAALIEWRDFTLLPHEQRTGKVLSSQSMETLRQVLDLISDADDQIDETLGEAQSMLADLMGVPNPKDGDGTGTTGTQVTDSEQLDHVDRAGNEEFWAKVKDLANEVGWSLRRHSDAVWFVPDDPKERSERQQLVHDLIERTCAPTGDENVTPDAARSSEDSSNLENRRPERERLPSMRNESTGSAEKRNDPTYEDYEIMYGLKNVKLAIAAVKACQLADPDGETDPDDLAVMAALEAADSAVDQAIIAQSKDGRTDCDDDERAQVDRFWTDVEEQAGRLGIALARDDEGVVARMGIADEAIEVRRTFSAKQREALASKERTTDDGSRSVANGIATQARVALAENDSDDLFLSLKLRSAR